MIARIDHIAIAVKEHAKALAFFRDILGAVPGECIEVKERKFFWQTLALGDMTRVEIISPSGDGSFLDGFLQKREGGFHHITLQTPDLNAMIRRLEEYGIPYFGRNEYPGGVWKEIFIHPRDAFGALIQIAEFDAAYWMVPAARMPEGERWRIEASGDGFALTCAHPGGGKAVLNFSREELTRLAEDVQHALQQNTK